MTKTTMKKDEKDIFKKLRKIAVSENTKYEDGLPVIFLLGGRLFNCGSSRLFTSVKRVVAFLSEHTVREECFSDLQDYLKNCAESLNSLYKSKYRLSVEPYLHGLDGNGCPCGIFSITAECGGRKKDVCDVYLYKLGPDVSFHAANEPMVFGRDPGGVRRWSP